MLSSEVHPSLTHEELAKIASFREKLAYKSVVETHRLYYEWAHTGKLTATQHTLLGRYIFEAT